MPRRIVTVHPGRKVPVCVSLYGIPPRRFRCPPPHTARTQSVVSIDRGQNYHGPLFEEFYVVRDDPDDPELLVLWIAGTGSQDQDDQARLYPVAWARYHDFWDEEAGGLSETAPAILLYAYIRTMAVWCEGHYTEDDIVASWDEQKTDLLAQVFRDALTGKPFRLPVAPVGRRGERPN